MELCTLEVIYALDARIVGDGEASCCRNNELGPDDITFCCSICRVFSFNLNIPSLGICVPRLTCDACIKDDLVVQVVFRGNCTPIVKDLGSVSIVMSPLWVQLGGKAVPVGGYITGAARIRVVAPRSTNIRSFLVNLRKGFCNKTLLSDVARTVKLVKPNFDFNLIAVEIPPSLQGQSTHL